MKELTTAQAAKQIGLSVARVRELCVQRNLGVMIGRCRFLTPAEIHSMTKRDKPGRPRKAKNGGKA